MNGMLFALVLGCGDPVIINDTKVWNDVDKRTLKAALKRCEELDPAMPCVEMFKKIEENVYTVMCGWKRSI